MVWVVAGGQESRQEKVSHSEKNTSSEKKNRVSEVICRPSNHAKKLFQVNPQNTNLLGILGLRSNSVCWKVKLYPAHTVN
jgi:hypothetical protein